MRFTGGAVDEIGRAVELPEEVAALLDAIAAQLTALAAGSCTDFEYWDKVHDALEGYRSATEATFSGKRVSMAASKLGLASGVFGAMLARMDKGSERAASHATAGVGPTYFKFSVSSFEKTGTTSTRGLPTVKVGGFEPTALPLFLEGPTRQMKTLTSHKERSAVYKAVAASDLRDTELDMFKVSASLKDEPFEIGRMKAFDAGWLEVAIGHGLELTQPQETLVTCLPPTRVSSTLAAAE